MILYTKDARKNTTGRKKPSSDDDPGVQYGFNSTNQECMSSILQQHQTWLVFRHTVGISSQDAAFFHKFLTVFTTECQFNDVKFELSVKMTHHYTEHEQEQNLREIHEWSQCTKFE